MNWLFADLFLNEVDIAHWSIGWNPQNAKFLSKTPGYNIRPTVKKKKTQTNPEIKENNR